MAMLDQFGAERAHGCVLLDAVAVGHDDDRRQPDAPRRECHALAVIAAGGRDHAGDIRLLPLQLLHVGESAAQLEGADRRVVLVLDPDLRARALAEQGPAILRRRQHDRMHGGGGGFELGETGQQSGSSIGKGCGILPQGRGTSSGNMSAYNRRRTMDDPRLVASGRPW